MKLFTVLKGFTLFVMTIAVAGCKSDFNIDVYSSDLFLNENVDTPAQMMVEIPTCSSRSEYEGRVLALFDAGSKAKIVGHDKATMTYGLYSSGTSTQQKFDAVKSIEYKK